MTHVDQRWLVRISDVSFTYPNGVQALSGVSLELAEGEVVFVQGWNGDGFESRAQVRRGYIGHDGQTRIGVEFIDAPTPDHVLARVRDA